MQGELALSVKRRHLRFLHPTFLADELNPKPLAGEPGIGGLDVEYTHVSKGFGD